MDKACDSVGREALYNILIEFGIPKKLVGLREKGLNETYSICTGKFSIQNDLKQGDALSPVLFNFAFKITIRIPNRTWKH
jgi:hypothetical protein